METRRASAAAGAAAATIGGVVLCGWIWDVDALKTIYGPITMKTNAAIGLLLCGLSLAMLNRAPRAVHVAGAFTALMAALTLSEHLAGWDLGIDQLLFTEPAGAAATASPNRMGPNATISLLSAGVALYALSRGTRRGTLVAQSGALLMVVLAAIPLAGYLYGAEQLYGIARYTGIALHTALAFVILALGILLARADEGPVAVFRDRGPAGTMLRRLAAPVVLIPLTLGYLEVTARNADVFDRGLGMALYAVLVILVLGATVWMTAHVIEGTERARRRAEQHRDVLMVSEREARAEAERASELKDQFLATLSHELRTPLNVMLGYTRLLEQGRRPEDHARIAGLVAKNGRLLARLVEDLLDVSRASAGLFELTRTDVVLSTAAQQAIDEVAAAAAAKGVRLVTELEPAMPPVEADPQRLHQIIANLLSNAVKFTEPGGRIVVRTSSGADAATLTVADTGIGFDPSFASDIFKPFRQADSSTTREHGGLGLGLSIARHLAELHHGTLTASSPGRGQGATFTLTMPRTARAESVRQRA